jgi:putative DNA primase/helicase
LKVPAIITNATGEYWGEMDIIGNFIKEQCVQRPGAAIRARELFQVYQDWCDESNLRFITSSMRESTEVCGFADKFFTGEIAACP